MNDLDKLIEQIDLKFRSANSVPVDRAWLRKSEWEFLLAAISAERIRDGK